MNISNKIKEQFFNAPSDQKDIQNRVYFKALNMIENCVEINPKNLPNIYDLLAESDLLSDIQKTCLFYAVKIKNEM